MTEIKQNPFWTRKPFVLAVLGILAVFHLYVPQACLAAEASYSAEALFIDTHTHLGKNSRSLSPEVAVRQMALKGVALTIILPPPFDPGHANSYGRPELISAVRAYPGKFAFVAGGETLNPMIHSVSFDKVTEAVAKKFRDEADAIAATGAAGFGEIAIEHFSANRGQHPYLSTQPDHPLLLVLADLGAKYGMPLDIHMEAVPQNMPFPRNAGGMNPNTLNENISGFERLLKHNPQTRIIWAHAGWDLSRERTIPLMRLLLGKYPNLYMSIKISQGGARPPLNPNGELWPDWLELLREFPDRFLIGSDQFYDEDELARIQAARKFADALPAEIAPLILRENAKNIYRLK